MDEIGISQVSIVLYGVRAMHQWAFFLLHFHKVYAARQAAPKDRTAVSHTLHLYWLFAFADVICWHDNSNCQTMQFRLWDFSSAKLVQAASCKGRHSHALSQDFFKRFWGKSAFIQNLSSPIGEIILAIPCTKIPFPCTPSRSVKSPHREGCIFKSNNSNFQHHANKCFDISKVS